MSLKGSKKVDTNRYELEITIDSEKFAEALKKAYHKNVSKINIPGFRKGKAPMSIIEKHYGESVFFEDALEILYPEAVGQAIDESKLDYVDDKIDFDLVSMDKATGVHFKVVITVKPEVELKNYKGLKAEKVKVVVDDSEIDQQVVSMAERNARFVAVEGRAAQLTDIAVIDFEGFIDDVAFEGGKGTSYSLTLGSGQFIPGFEDQIVGHSEGEEFDVNVTFPKEYPEQKLADKPAVFKVKINELKMRELPKIDDEFAKDVSEFETLDELKNDIRKKTIERKNQEADNDVENQLIDQLVTDLKADIPQAMFNNRIDMNIQDFSYKLQMQGMNMETYMQYAGGNIDELKKSFAPQAERQVKLRLALEKIVELEKITVSDDEIESEFKKMAENYKIEIEKAKASISKKELEKDMAVSKAIDFVKENAVIKEVEKKTDEVKEIAKSKKSPDKKTSTTRATSKKSPAKKSDETK